MVFVIAYNLYQCAAINSYLPNAYISGTENRGTRLGYMKAKATRDTVGSYSIDYLGTDHELLSDLIDSLSIENLEKTFAKKGRKKNVLSELYEDKDKSSLIKQYVDRKMNAFFDLLVKNEYYLCLEIERKVVLEDIKIAYANEELNPALFFKKTQTGIHYMLRLIEEGKQVICHEHDIHLCTDMPARIIKDYTLYGLSKVNSNKLKPFLKKDSIFIPQEKVGVYFEKFILNVASKVDIYSDGFDVVKKRDVLDVKLELSKDFLLDKYLLDVRFEYEGASFLYGNPGRKKTRMEVGEDGAINIFQIIRSEQEETYADKLQSLGLKKNSSNRFYSDEEDKYDVIQWLISNRGTLNKEGISTNGLEIEGSPLSLEHGELIVDTTKNNDWFDMRGGVQLGDHLIPFADLLENIREENPLFILPDGKIYVIPEAMMTKYSSIAKFSEKTESGCRVNKANYMFLEELDDSDNSSLTEYRVEEQDFEYVKSEFLKADLRPYQTDGVKWLITHQKNGLGACLADDMGLGKTIQTLAVLNYTKDNLQRKADDDYEDQQLSLFGQERVEEVNPLRALIILPSSLVFNWFEEIKKFSPRFHVMQYVGAKRKEKTSQISGFDIVLTTYHTALRDVKILQKTEWEYIILDESQVIKNKESKVFQAITSLETKYKISLSGTPIENSLSDLWSQMEFINPDMLGNYKFFKSNFQNPIERHQDEAALDVLKSMVKPFILRRRKEEVAKDLPELTKKLDYIEMNDVQSDIYEKEKSAARNYLLSLDASDPEYRMHVFTSLLRLRQIANHPVLMDSTYEDGSGKFDRIIDQIDQVYKSGNKVLVFSAFKSHLKLVEDYLKSTDRKYCKLTGDTSQAARKGEVHRFQEEDKYQAFLISLKAGGVGLNLTKADYVFILDPWWNPFIEEQAIARAHRIGQENPVTVIRFISKGSLEEKIVKLQARKSVLSADIIETEEMASFTRDELVDLLD